MRLAEETLDHAAVIERDGAEAQRCWNFRHEAAETGGIQRPDFELEPPAALPLRTRPGLAGTVPGNR
ncbi:MAG: hypothetical protein WDN69_34485 [Aliidongia sp.]